MNFVEIELASGNGFASVRADHVSVIQSTPAGDGCMVRLTNGGSFESSESKATVLSKVEGPCPPDSPLDETGERNAQA